MKVEIVVRVYALLQFFLIILAVGLIFLNYPVLALIPLAIDIIALGFIGVLAMRNKLK